MLTEERTEDGEEALRVALDGRQADIWTAIPGIVQSYNAAHGTVVVQPSIQYAMRTQAGVVSRVTLPLLVDCPAQFPGGSGMFLSFTPTMGDECLVCFAQRCIDAWWQNGGVQPQAEFRMHDPSDGFALLGFSSVPNVPKTATPAGVIELRNTARTVRISVHPNGLLDFVNGNGSIKLNADGSTSISGNLTVGGTLAYGDADRKIALDGDPIVGGEVKATGTQGKGS